jgi:hypothetical protein
MSGVSMPPTASSNQATLCEQLQLLHELSYSDLGMPYQFVHSTRNIRDKHANSEIRILDTIAISLTTGEPGDVVAAVLDKSGRMCLVLAKNGVPTLEDESAVQRFIAAIMDPEVKDAIDLFPTLVSRCHANMNKRIAKLHESISEFRAALASILLKYTSMPNNYEFPGLNGYGPIVYDATPTFHTIINDLVQEIWLSSSSPINPSDIFSSRQQFLRLHLLASALADSRLLTEIKSNRNDSDPGKQSAEKLKRRLDKVNQYFRGVNKVIKAAKK